MSEQSILDIKVLIGSSQPELVRELDAPLSTARWPTAPTFC
jgi:hypothetical protein